MSIDILGSALATYESDAFAGATVGRQGQTSTSILKANLNLILFALANGLNGRKRDTADLE